MTLLTWFHYGAEYRDAVVTLGQGQNGWQVGKGQNTWTIGNAQSGWTTGKGSN